MGSRQRMHCVSAICLLVNGALLAANRVAWQVEGVSLPHRFILLSCAAVATISCLLRLMSGYLHDGTLVSSGWRLEALFSTIEVVVLTVLMSLLFESD